jgi:rhodanese-related sulfurtransferase
MKTFFNITGIIFASLILFASCSKQEIKTYESLDQKLEETAKVVKMISPDALKKAIESETTFYLIDCREPEEYDSASIKTAINIPRGLVEFQISNKAPNHRANVYVFSNDTKRAMLVAAELPMLKYANVKVLDKGFNHLKTAFPELVELSPAGASKETNTPPPGSGGCGG